MKRSKRKSPKKRNRNSNRRNCRYSGSLSKFLPPYCDSGWDYVDDEELFKQGKILEKLGPDEKFCKNKDKPKWPLLVKKKDDKIERDWYIDVPRYRNNLDKDGYNPDGFKNGFNKDGYDYYGFNKDGYDENGYDENGFDKEGINKDTKTKYNKGGFDKERINKDTGKKFDKRGYNINGALVKYKRLDGTWTSGE